MTEPPAASRAAVRPVIELIGCASGSERPVRSLWTVTPPPPDTTIGPQHLQEHGLLLVDDQLDRRFGDLQVGHSAARLSTTGMRITGRASSVPNRTCRNVNPSSPLHPGGE